MTQSPPQTVHAGILTRRRLVPLLLLGGAVAAVFAFGLDRYLTLSALQENRAALQGFVAEQGAWALLAYIAVYAVTIALSVPGAAVLTMAGGFLFGVWLGAAAATVGASAGAVAIFLIARSTLGEPLRARAGPALRRMEAGFRENALSYLLVLRLIPLFPFFLVNIVPAFLGVRLRIYALATALGIIPGCVVYATVGAGLGSIVAQGGDFSPASALTPEVIAALIGLAALALLPVAYKTLRRRRTGRTGPPLP